MRLAALSTSTSVGSVALWEDGRVVGASSFASGILHGRALLPALEALFRERGWKPADARAVAVDIGPGSYTGVRIGLAAAKVIAHGTGAVLVGISALEAAAHQALAAVPSAPTVAVVFDARRGRVYGGLFARGAGRPARLRGPVLEAAGAWAEARAALWAGDALSVQPHLFAGLPRAPEETWTPAASAVAFLGAARAARGERDDPYRTEPLYLKAAEAEERLADRRSSEAPRREPAG